MEKRYKTPDNTVNLIISIDVEEDMPDWKAQDQTTVRNIAGISRLQDLFDEYGIKPTYLLTSPIAEDKDSVSVFLPILKSNRCEIGSHLHPWTTPPVNAAEKDKLMLPSNLDERILREKLINLTGSIRDSFGMAPVSYRAGRFGFNKSSALILRDLGYMVDTSITPLRSWENINGPNFLYDRIEPHFLNEKYGDDSLSELVEVPVSIALTKNLTGLLKRLYLTLPKVTRIRGLLSKDYLNIIDMIWLYPVLYTAEEMTRLSDILVGRGNRVLNMFFHSNEIKVGESIYHKTERDIAGFYDKLKYYFDYIFSRYRVQSRTLKEYRNYFIGERT
ncbi:MAG: hypothetical protein AMK71_00345 [Nitrospira bacterium SG8_35_4]|nr:MAG: hypothetical protein AMK71_00345 [Nitrospira bacterium SG8_35_4]